MFDKFWKNALFVLVFAIGGGLIVLAILSVLHNKIVDVGSWADWFAAVGTIFAVAVSVWITRYQLQVDQKNIKNSFFYQQEFKMLDDIQIKLLENVSFLSQVEFFSVHSREVDGNQMTEEFYNRYFSRYYQIIVPNNHYISNRMSEYSFRDEKYEMLSVAYFQPIVQSFDELEELNISLKEYKDNLDSNFETMLLHSPSGFEIKRFKPLFDNVIKSMKELEKQIIQKKSDIKKH
ncbi:hypothetical protein [Leuconostoc suionicum]|uniref:hypothetical protein n=1 Tax=Leuconostoc suionicum TaxID=1511761 RepID=UPI00233E6452|nr:hypothetical protein [Leuconostoc suionicum]MDC2805566.1 hypothetical protein [Leuconostoc suionicum]MDC2823078.1 hypothetical protein [Leuconostoc suionicum]